MNYSLVFGTSDLILNPDNATADFGKVQYMSSDKRVLVICTQIKKWVYKYIRGTWVLVV